MKKCLFCSTPLTRRNRSRMPVFPRWLLYRLKVQNEIFIGTHWNYPNEPTIINSQREQDFFSLALGNVCSACNTGWMVQLEEDARSLIEAFLPGRSTVLTRAQCDILAKWTFKTAATLNYSVNYKRIIPLEQIHQFSLIGQLPENATVDFAWCYTDMIHWFLGGNKKFALHSKRIKEAQKKAAYVITLQFGHILLRLAWVPIEGIKAFTIPTNAIYRIFPQLNSELKIDRGPIFKDDEQLHFIATILAEEGVYPNNIEFHPKTKLFEEGNLKYVVWNGHTQKDYHWDGRHDCAVTSDNRLISVQKARQYFLRNGIEPVVVFTCQLGQPSVEVNIPGEGWNGLGTYCFCKVMRDNPDISLRDLITNMNEAIAEMGFDQIGEVSVKKSCLTIRLCQFSRTLKTPNP